MDLLDIFFEYVYPYMPFLEKKYFCMNLDSKSPFLMYSMYALASVHTPMDRENHESSRYYEFARSLFNHYLDEPLIYSVLGLLMLGVYSVCKLFYNLSSYTYV
jgi:hypothetical protein